MRAKGRGKFDAALRYYRVLEDNIVAAIVEANGKLAAAHMATGTVQLEGFNRNRQTKIEPKPVDRELAVLRIDDNSGKPVAILASGLRNKPVSSSPSSRDRIRITAP